MTKQTQKQLKEKAEKFDKLAADLLPRFNAIKDILDRFDERDYDLRLSDIEKLYTLKWQLRNAFDYSPQKSNSYDGEAAHWADYVLPGDERAWHYEGGE